MTGLKITAHTLVKNEQRWVWYALMSVLDFVDEILVWDTGSTDKTPEIIASIASPKIKYRQLGPVDPESHTEARRQMLDMTDADWILVLDGDEIWWHSSLAACRDLITHNSSLLALISPVINLVGDVYHHDPKSGNYTIGSYHGAYNLRFINRKITGLHVGNPHGRQEYRDGNETPLQKFPSGQLQFIDAPLLHTTHLPRSVSRIDDQATLKRGFKFRYDLGREFPGDFVYPECLYLPAPDLVPDPWFHRSLKYLAVSSLYTPARLVKNILLPKKSGGY